MKRKTGPLIAIGASIVLAVSALTGCSSAMEDAQARIDNTGLDVLNTSKVVRECTDLGFDQFTFLGADFSDVRDGRYAVDVSGIARHSQDQGRSYVSMKYSLDESLFEGLDEKDKPAIINAVCDAMEKYEMKSFSLAPVKNVPAFNKTLKAFSESPVDGYKYYNGLVMSVDNIKIDKEKGCASFQIKNFVDYNKVQTEYVPMYIYTDDGMTLVMTPQTRVYHEDFVHTNDIYVKASPEELEAFEKDPSLIFEKFVEFVNSEQKDKYVVNSVAVDKVTNFDIVMKDEVDVEREM